MSQCQEKPPELFRRLFQIIAFDWDGTAVTDRSADAREVTAALEELLMLDFQIVVITGTNLGNVDRQFSSHVRGPHKKNLYICANRGSEVFGFGSDSQTALLFRREATDEENSQLDQVAEAVKADIESASRLQVNIIYDRLNRRKIDLIPEWENPPKSQIGELIKKTEERLTGGGFEAGIKGAFDLAVKHSQRLGLKDARITSDVKHIEVGLTDKADSMRWILEGPARNRLLRLEEILVAGDEFGPVAGFEGSDFHMVLSDSPGIFYFSVGKEPNGVPPGVVHIGGGPPCFVEVMRRQAQLRQELKPTRDESFLLVEEGFSRFREREAESLLTLSNGYLGTRGSLEEDVASSGPATLIAGVYDRAVPEGLEELTVAPDWLFTRITNYSGELRLGDENMLEHRRVLDMAKGVLYRQWRCRDDYGGVTLIQFTRFVSMANPHALVLRVAITPENYSGVVRVQTGLRLCRDCRVTLESSATGPDATGALTLTGRMKSGGTTIAMAQKTRIRQDLPEAGLHQRADETGVYDEWSWHSEMGRETTIEKYVSVFTSREVDDPAARAAERVHEMAGYGLTGLLLDHIDAWNERWAVAGVKIEGDGRAQHWLNFACFHLIGAGNPQDDRASVSARALTGTIYRGHIFWDTEIFILPFFVFSNPAAARAALMYRYNTLPVARANAIQAGYRGALFPWESASTGEEMAPRAVLSPTGEVIRVTSGDLEDHVVSDIAYAACTYWRVTGDTEFLLEAGAELLLETARFWVSRAQQRGGSYHLMNVEGPDEYHDQGVDDNYYTNAMAARNIARAVEISKFIEEEFPERWKSLREKICLRPGERQEWAAVAGGMYKDLRPGSNLIEQFAGYFRLQDINVHDYEPRTAPLKVILGDEKAAASQLVKQADVVMALYLLEDELSEEIVRANFDYYDQRTDHGSSLSLAIYGLVAARLGKMDRALRYFRRAGQIDLANNMGNAAGGVHIAALGGLWQQVIMGFAGVRVESGGLSLWPRLPEEWRRLAFQLLWNGMELEFDIERDHHILLVLKGEGMVSAGIHGGLPLELSGGRTYRSRFSLGGWSDFREAEEGKGDGR